MEVSAPHTSVFASANLFDLLGVPVAVGRIHPQDDRRGAPPVVVLSERYWKTTFGGDPNIVGRVITISRVMKVSDVNAAIVGVAPRAFRGTNLASPPDFYMPLNTLADLASSSPMEPNWFADPRNSNSPTTWLTIAGTLRQDSTIDSTAARLASLPSVDPKWKESYGVLDLSTTAVNERARAGMSEFAELLAATVGLLLLIGCATVGILLLLRTEARRGEFAMCLALGASKGRLATGIAMEAGLISVAGAVAALPIAQALIVGVRAFRLPGNVNIDRLDLTMNASAVAVCASCALMAMTLIAVISASFGWSANVADGVHSRAGATPRIMRRRVRTILAAAQVTVSLVLLVGAGLFVRSLIAALQLNPGYDTTHIMTTDLQPVADGYTPQTADAFFDQLQRRLGATSLIRSYAFTDAVNGLVGGGGRLTIDGEARQLPPHSFSAVDERYFGTIGLRVTEGRDFSASDSSGSPLVGIVSASFARIVVNDGSPLGHRITLPGGRPGRFPIVEIVGVVPDIVTNVKALSPLTLYVPFRQVTLSARPTLVIRAAADASSVKRVAEAAIRAINPSARPGPIQTIDEILMAQLAPQQFGAVVLTALGLIATVLTMLGARAVCVDGGAAHARDDRAALGASGLALSAIVLRETVRLAGIGLVAASCSC